MSSTRKYAGLPDIDVSSRDVFETPDLTDDVSTLPTSPSITNQDVDDNEEGLLRTGLRLSDARTVFSDAIIDATDVDFSDRVSGKRKSYKASTRRRKDNHIYGDDDEDEDGEHSESVRQKLARLQREAEELRQMMEDSRGIDNGEDEDQEEEDAESWDKLTDVLDGLMTMRNKNGTGKTVMFKKLANSVNAQPPVSQDTSSTSQHIGSIQDATIPTASYTISYSPQFKNTHTLAKVANFDSRITLLERLLGISTTTTISLTTNSAIIPSIENLTKQLTVLTTSSATVLDAASRRVKALTHEAEKLTESRKAAARAAGDNDDLSSISQGNAIGGDAENESKINALYGTLSTIESYAPLLPAVLDRLRSLRGIHAEAARSVKALEEVERKQEEMRWEIEKWREALENVETSVDENGRIVDGNVDKVEEWVKDLEERLSRLG